MGYWYLNTQIGDDLFTSGGVRGEYFQAWNYFFNGTVCRLQNSFR